jgi:hypothetical protein
MSQIINWFRSSELQNIVYTVSDGMSALGKALVDTWYGNHGESLGFYISPRKFEGIFQKMSDLGHGRQYDLELIPIKSQANYVPRIIAYFTTVNVENIEMVDSRSFAIQIAQKMETEYDRPIVIVRFQVKTAIGATKVLNDRDLIVFVDPSGDLRGGYYLHKADALTTSEDIISKFVN